MAAQKPIKVVELVDLARDKSEAGRSTLVAAIGGLYADQNRQLTTHDRTIMAEILEQIISEVEISVRSALADRFADLPNAPQELILALANDEIEVARPVLEKSEVLGDTELMDVIKYRTMEHHLSIAVRRYVSEAVSNALVETDNEVVVTRLLENKGARIATGTMTYLVEQSRKAHSYQSPLAERNDLSPALAKMLYHNVSDAVRSQIVERFDLDPGDLDVVFESAVEDATARRPQPEGKKGARKKRSVGSAREAQRLITLLRAGDVPGFVDAFAEASGLPLATARRFIFEEGGQNLAISCRALGYDKGTFLSIFIWGQQGRLGEKQVEQAELAQALTCFEDTSAESAAEVLEAWRSGDAA